jgi:hypothetical protein
MVSLSNHEAERVEAGWALRNQHQQAVMPVTHHVIPAKAGISLH